MKKKFFGILGLILSPISLIGKALDWMWREHFDVFTGFACILCGGAIFFAMKKDNSDFWSLVVTTTAAVVSIIYLQMKRGDDQMKRNDDQMKRNDDQMNKVVSKIESIRKLLSKIEKQLPDKNRDAVKRQVIRRSPIN